MTQIKKLIAGNWKMNGSLQANAALLQGLRGGLGQPACNVAVAVPAPYLAQVQALVSGTPIGLAAQDVSQHDGGAYTGEVSAAMLRDFGARYVLVGHSERRQYHGESDKLVNEKAKALLEKGISPIICVGESLEQREMDLTMEYVAYQVKAALSGIDATQLRRCIIAYEPIWAIGTGKTATAEQAQEVCEGIRAVVRKIYGARPARAVSILYGGSMNAKNASELLAMPDIDGGLIGGASLKPADFSAIIAATAQD